MSMSNTGGLSAQDVKQETPDASRWGTPPAGAPAATFAPSVPYADPANQSFVPPPYTGQPQVCSIPVCSLGWLGALPRLISAAGACVANVGWGRASIAIRQHGMSHICQAGGFLCTARRGFGMPLSSHHPCLPSQGTLPSRHQMPCLRCLAGVPLRLTCLVHLKVSECSPHGRA